MPMFIHPVHSPTGGVSNSASSHSNGMMSSRGGVYRRKKSFGAVALAAAAAASLAEGAQHSSHHGPGVSNGGLLHSSTQVGFELMCSSGGVAGGTVVRTVTIPNGEFGTTLRRVC